MVMGGKPVINIVHSAKSSNFFALLKTKLKIDLFGKSFTEFLD